MRYAWLFYGNAQSMRAPQPLLLTCNKSDLTLSPRELILGATEQNSMQNMLQTTHHAAQQPIPANYEPQKHQDSEAGSINKRQKSRHRASIACAACRERRIRVRASTSH